MGSSRRKSHPPSKGQTKITTHFSVPKTPNSKDVKNGIQDEGISSQIQPKPEPQKKTSSPGKVSPMTLPPNRKKEETPEKPRGELTQQNFEDLPQNLYSTPSPDHRYNTRRSPQKKHSPFDDQFLFEADLKSMRQKPSKTIKKKKSPIKAVSEYEELRLKTIEKNKELLKSLFGEKQILPEKPISINTRAPSTRKPGGARKSLPGPATIRTRSSRTHDPNNNNTEHQSSTSKNNDLETETNKPIDALVFWERKGKKPVAITDGYYEGWVEDGLRKELGIEENASLAWEKNGGGSWKKTESKERGLDAKSFSKTQLKKNPNAYFYRHTAPGYEHWMGDFTLDETKTFLKVAAKYGVGNKWGLFATHLPHRVGYQCSNFYRDIVVPSGWVVDTRFCALNNRIVFGRSSFGRDQTTLKALFKGKCQTIEEWWSAAKPMRKGEEGEEISETEELNSTEQRESIPNDESHPEIDIGSIEETEKGQTGQNESKDASNQNQGAEIESIEINEKESESEELDESPTAAPKKKLGRASQQQKKLVSASQQQNQTKKPSSPQQSPPKTRPQRERRQTKRFKIEKN